MSLERFKEAQAAAHAGFDQARSELRRGRKTSHWIWYVFPQLAGLGSSATARQYAFADAADALHYAQDDELRERLVEVTRTVGDQLESGRRLTQLMGAEIDAMKLVSSLTLFEQVTRRSAAPKLQLLSEQCTRVLDLAAQQGFPRCAFTQRRLAED